MAYKFKMQNLLNYKETVEGLRKTEYGESLSRLREEEDILREYNREKETLLEDISSLEGINIGSLRTYKDYIGDLSQQIDQQKEEVNKSRLLMNKAKEALVEAMQEKKAFEKLKEKDHKAYLLEEKRAEEKVIDEIVTFKTKSNR